MGKCYNLKFYSDPIFGMSLTKIEIKGTYIKANPDKPKVKALLPNNSKPFHLRRPKIT